METRRTYVGLLAAAGLGIGGCVGSPSGGSPDADVIVGPNARLTFEPERLTISSGETVTWYFDSNGHNVSGVPEHAASVSLPAGAAPFSSYGDAGEHRTVASGETYAHTFDVSGVYRYVCIPHRTAGMEGRIAVS